MDTTNDITQFLAFRRAKITPKQAGLPTYGKRRVPGLRREEVASLAGSASTTTGGWSRGNVGGGWSRGNVGGASESVVVALASALQLDDAERAHLFDLARAVNPTVPRRRRPVGQRVRPVVQRILDSMSTPAVVRNSRVDYLAANQLGRALYAPLFESREQPANSARFTFLDPAAADFYSDWARVADDLVAHLRSEAGRNQYDRGLSDLIGAQTGTKRIHHPLVGELNLSYETMELSADSGLNLTVYTAEAGSASQQALDLIASWTATPDQAARRSSARR